jgi:hypothetical protein
VGEKRNVKEGVHFEGIYINDSIILQSILKILDGRVWTSLLWLKVGTSGRLLRTW